MSNNRLLTEAGNVDFLTMIQTVIKNDLFVDFGVIQEVLGKGVVNVSVSVANTKEDIMVETCVLANIASKAFSIDIEPQKGDKVLILYPRKFDSNMFTVDDNAEIIVNKYAKGYSVFGGIAILCNQFKTDSYKNFIKFNKDGEADININNVKLEVNKDDEITIDNGKAKVEIDKNGNVKIDTSGKYTIKNNSTNLKDVIDGLATEVKNLVTIGSPATQKTSPATSALIDTWKATKLNLLFD